MYLISLQGFKFDVGGGLSNNFQLTGSFNMPNPSLPKAKNPYGMPQVESTGDFNLGI